MNDIITYRPHKYMLPFSIFAAFLAVFYFVITGCAIEQGVYVLVPAAMGIVSIWLSKFLYDLYNITVFFEEKGVRITGGKHKIYRYVLWEEMPYAYYATNFKGFAHLILSPRELSRKEAKKLANRGGNSAKLRSGDAVVMVLDPSAQDMAPIKEWINQRVLHIEDTTKY